MAGGHENICHMQKKSQFSDTLNFSKKYIALLNYEARFPRIRTKSAAFRFDLDMSYDRGSRKFK